MEIPGVITNDKSDVLAKCQGQRSEVKVTEVKTQHKAKKIVNFDPSWAFCTATPGWIHQWLQNDAQSLK